MMADGCFFALEVVARNRKVKCDDDGRTGAVSFGAHWSLGFLLASEG